MNSELFSRRGLSLERLQTLCLVAEHGSLVKAADGDAVRQSQFSRQLKELGSYFNCELTRRKGQGIELTEDGREIAALGLQVLRAIDDTRRTSQKERSQLILGAGESFIQWSVIPVLHELKKRMPDMLISLRNLRSEQILTELLASRLDFGILALSEPLPEGLEHSSLGKQRYCIFVTKIKGQRPDLKTTLRMPWFGLEGESRLNARIKAIAEEAGIQLKPAVLCSSLPAVALALEQAHGFAVLPEDANPAGTEKISLPDLSGISRTVSLVWNVRRLGIREQLERRKAALLAALSW